MYEVPQKDTGDIRFETDSYKTVSSPYKVVVPKMINLIMKLSGGAIKEQKQAEYILAGLALLMFLTSLYFFFR